MLLCLNKNKSAIIMIIANVSTVYSMNQAHRCHSLDISTVSTGGNITVFLSIRNGKFGFLFLPVVLSENLFRMIAGYTAYVGGWTSRPY